MSHEPAFQKQLFDAQDQYFIEPFFTNLDHSVYAPTFLPPEMIGALCSRTSRAPEDLRTLFLKEYIRPFLFPQRESSDTDESYAAKERYGSELREFIDFVHAHPIQEIFANPRARSFFVKWLAQYGDDSIAQMAGMHVVFERLSQVAIKHLEDQRIGLAPIEKSTRYVNYGNKENGKYLYYRDPDIAKLGLMEEYEQAMNGLFDAYRDLLPKLTEWLKVKFPEEKPGVIEKKGFDTLRGLLPTSTYSQVAFFGNGQSFEYAVARSAEHHLGEIRWAGEKICSELSKLTPSFFRRLKDEERREATQQYQEYLSGKRARMQSFVQKHFSQPNGTFSRASSASVSLVEYDPLGQEKVITGMLYDAQGSHKKWDELLRHVCGMKTEEKKRIIADYLKGRSARWQKVGRAFENAYVRFEVVMDIGAWRDLHRHRMLTQQRQEFTCAHGFDVPPEVEESGLETVYSEALERAGKAYEHIAERDPVLAQYAVPLAYRTRFQCWENLRECFWETELRSIPEGHPNYRHVAQQKFYLLKEVYPLIAEHMLVNVGEYDFARRGQEERIQKKLEQLSK